MQAQKTRPAFQSVELDPMDLRLEAKAAAKGIPTLVAPPPVPAPVEPQRDPAPARPRRKRAKTEQGAQSTPRSRMKGLNVEVPDYAWIAIKTRAAREMVSVRHVIMAALKTSGIEIKDGDMIEDGRRLRGD